MNIRITDSKDLQQQSTTRPAETNNADAFSQTLQQVQYAQVKPATQVAGISAAEIKTDASKQSNEAKRSVLGDIFDYIEVFYNRRRRHSHLGLLSPADYEERERLNEAVECL